MAVKALVAGAVVVGSLVAGTASGPDEKATHGRTPERHAKPYAGTPDPAAKASATCDRVAAATG